MKFLRISAEILDMCYMGEMTLRRAGRQQSLLAWSRRVTDCCTSLDIANDCGIEAHGVFHSISEDGFQIVEFAPFLDFDALDLACQ